MNKVLAIFDFDGTLTIKDTFLELIRYQKGWFSFWSGFCKLSPFVALHLVKIIPNWKAKEKVLSHFFKGENIKDFQSKCDQFSMEVIPTMFRSEAIKKLEQHQKAGHEVVVISASAENWLSGWCKSKGVKLIATRLEVESEKLTGRILGKNCYGPEKLKRLEEQFDLSEYSEVHVYGDSRGDREILEVASHRFFRQF